MVQITPSLRETTYAPVSSTTDFPVGFPIFGRNIGEFPATDLEVVVNDVKRTDFTVIATFSEGVSTNAVVRMNSGVTGSVIVRGKRTPRRTDQYANGAPLRIPDHNYSLNRIEAELQELSRDSERSLIGLLAEIAARIAGDLALHSRVNQEIVDRVNGDKALASLIGQAGDIAEHIFESNLAASFAEIKPTFRAILTLGRNNSSDGEGGVYVDEANGSADRFNSSDGRTWYRAPDVSLARLTKEARATNRATITHHRDGGIIYDVINIYGDPLKLTKKVGKDINAAGHARRVTAREMLKDHNYPALINADGARASTPGVPWDQDPIGRGCGLQICDGIAYQGWANEDRTQNIVMMRDGRLRMAYKEDGITPEQWVAMGAVWSVGWGCACVLDGVAQTIPWYMNNIVSARTILGQKYNGDLILITVEGDSNDYGLLPGDCAALAIRYGCKIAYICDGGGSTQVWWGNCYAHPSSDSNGTVERKLYSFFALDLPSVPVYDSGDIDLVRPSWSSGRHQPNLPSVSVRQVGPLVTARLNLSGPTPTGTSVALLGADIARRYWADGINQMRGLIHQGSPGYVYANTTGTLLMSAASAMNYGAGPISWPAKWSAATTHEI